MAIRILSSENISGEVLIASGKYLSWGTSGATSIEGSTVSNKLQFRTNSTNAVIIDSSQNVGIGTVSPDQTGYGYKTLTIMGGTTAGYAGVLELLTPSTDANGQNLGIISFGSGGTRNAMIGAVRQSGNNNGKLQFWTAAGANGIENRMTIDADGQVGIGTDDPDGKVHIFKGSNGGTTLGTASDELVLENDTDCGLTIRSAADATGVVSFASPTDHNVGQLYYNHDDDSMVIRTNDAIRTIIGSSGIMYIMGATASTNNSLQLQYNSTAGTAEIYSKSTGGNTTFEFYTSNSGTTTQKFNIGSSGDVKITTNGKFLQGVRNTSGTVIDMIGFGAGTDRLQIKGGTSGGAESIAFFDTAGQMATFYNSRFGIGITSPSFPLDVNGIIRSSTSNVGYLYLGNTVQGTIPAGAIIAQRSPSYTSTGKLLFQVPTWGANTDYGLTTQMSIEVTGADTRAATMVLLEHGGKVGIGENSPSTLLSLKGGADTSIITLKCTKNDSSWNGERIGGIDFFSEDGSGPGAGIRGSINYKADSSSGGNTIMTFNTGDNTERMRILNGGTVYIGDVTNSYGYSAHHIAKDSSQGYALIIRNSNTSTNNNSVIQLNQAETTSTTQGYFMICRQGDPNSGTNRLWITSNGDVKNVNNSYGAISDERLKENIVDATPKLDDLMKVKVRNFNLKGEETKQIGVVAQELEEVFPGMIDESKNPDSDDETLYKSVKYSVFVPMLIKSIQELKAEIELLKNK